MPQPSRRQPVDRLEGLLDGVDDAGLVAVERLDRDCDAALGGVLGDRRAAPRAAPRSRPRARRRTSARCGRPTRRSGRRRSGAPTHRRGVDAGRAGSPASRRPSRRRWRTRSRPGGMTAQHRRAARPCAARSSAARRGIPVAGLLDRQLDRVEAPGAAMRGTRSAEPLVGERRGPDPRRLAAPRRGCRVLTRGYLPPQSSGKPGSPRSRTARSAAAACSAARYWSRLSWVIVGCGSFHCLRHLLAVQDLQGGDDRRCATGRSGRSARSR